MKKQAQAKHREKMIRLVKQWQSSGESKVSFCQIHNIPKCQFYYWSSKYEKEESSPSGFLPVQVNKESKTEKILDRMEIRYSNGTSIYLPLEVSLDLIGSLVRL
jgi:ssDNA-binding Zn-finger/Zn-ribbon topoisomerase 1